MTIGGGGYPGAAEGNAKQCKCYSSLIKEEFSTNLSKTTLAKDFEKDEVVGSEFAHSSHAGFYRFSVFVPDWFIWIHVAVATVARFGLLNKELFALQKTPVAKPELKRADETRQSGHLQEIISF